MKHTDYYAVHAGFTADVDLKPSEGDGTSKNKPDSFSDMLFESFKPMEKDNKNG